MVNFKNMNSGSDSSPTDPLKIFQRLPKPPQINDLWESQSEALKLWTQRRKEQDLVIKLNTGGGKTLVGLLIGQALINELAKPVVYLCPNNQLVSQTVEKAGEIGIAACAYEPGPGDLPTEFDNAEAILIASYQALFHGRSKFGILGGGKEPLILGGVICDDAHTAFSTVRDAFSISIDRNKKEDLYKDLASRFRADFEAIGRVGTFDDIVERQDGAVLEVPYTAWATKADGIRNLLSRSHANDFRYRLPLLRDRFDCSHALISARDFYITALQPLVHLFPSFDDCRRRVYMSATIADDSAIIRTFGANPKCVSKPIVPKTLAGVGERMILAPSLTKTDQKEHAKLVRDIVTRVAKTYGVVVLVSSERAASRWKAVGTVKMGDAVEAAVDDLLRRKSNGPFIFPGRYDGIDLIGNACRLLILDGMPRGANTYEVFRAEVLQATSSLNISLAQKLEQGMGRATRGAGDYCVVLLLGPELVAWITRRHALGLMTPSTRAQVLMGHEISKAINTPHDFLTTVLQCLERDPTWTKYHAETLADRSELPDVDASTIDMAAAERKYVAAFSNRQFAHAAQIALEAANQHQPDRRLRGWLLQLAARARYYADEPNAAADLQREAYAANGLLWAPAGMGERYESITTAGNQVENILGQIARFAVPKGHLEDFEDAVSYLTPGASSNQLEDALRRLGTLLGFHSERPEQEYGLGPDVLWLPDADVGLVIEAKSKKLPDNPLNKGDHGQLLVSAEWFKQHYPERRCIRIHVHPSPKATEPSMAQDTLALTFEQLDRMVASLRCVLREICLAALPTPQRTQLCEKLLLEQRLTPSLLPSEYLQKFQIE